MQKKWQKKSRSAPEKTRKTKKTQRSPAKTTRINKYLHERGYCGRREADRLVERGVVFVNDTRAVLGQQIGAHDTVRVHEKAYRDFVSRRVYVLLNKPKGYVSHNPLPHEKEAISLLPKPLRSAHLAPIGRLDKASRGLMLFSNDGRIVDALLNPDNKHEKEYEVEVNKTLTPTFMYRMEHGVPIEHYRTKPAILKKISSTKFRLTLTEGKKHQIRRMCMSLGYHVTDLKRVRIGTLHLGNLKEGSSRSLMPEEIRLLRKVISSRDL